MRLPLPMTALLLVAVNLIPLIGVAFWGWSLMLILVLYWVESGVVGAINVFKIARAAGQPGRSADGGAVGLVSLRIGSRDVIGKAALIGFFVLHYGIFWVVHGVFVFLLPLFAGLTSMFRNPDGLGFGPADFGPLPLDGLALSAALMAASHVVSFFVNYVGRGEYLRIAPQAQMMSVYGRVAVLHVTILAGAFLVGWFGTPLAALTVLIGLKTALDLFFHVREHRAASGTTTAG